MKILMTTTAIIFTIMMMLMILINLVSKKTNHDREKSSPFECGFDPKTSARLPFSSHFFLIAIIFLIFDVEITLLFPMIITLKYTNMTMHITMMTMFIMILLAGLIHEWKQGALDWTS